MTGEEIKALLSQVQRDKIVSLEIHDDDALFDAVEKAGGSVSVYPPEKSTIGRYYEVVGLVASDRNLRLTVFGSTDVRHGERVPKPTPVAIAVPAESRFAYLEVD